MIDSPTRREAEHDERLDAEEAAETVNCAAAFDAWVELVAALGGDD